jgi:hypothetical protein
MISNDNMLDDISRVNPYLAPDGGARLHLNDRAVLAGQETVSNQNPILYLAYMARAIGDKQVPWDSVALHHAQYVCLGKGRYIRRKGDPLRQSHDNVLAWAWFACRGNIYLEKIAKDIYDFAKWRLYVYNPHKRFSFDVRCWLQFSHTFILSLAANKRPSWLSCLWFSVSCIVGDHSADYYLKSMLRSDIVRAKSDSLSKYKKKLVFFGLNLMEKRREGLGRWYKDYFHEDAAHPAVTVW